MIITNKDGLAVNTAYASKQSRLSLGRMFSVHTSVLVPLLALPILPFMITLKVSLYAIIVLIILERYGYTLNVALRKMRSLLAGRDRTIHSRRWYQRMVSSGTSFSNVYRVRK